MVAADKSAEEVKRYLAETSQIIQHWIDEAQRDTNYPVSKHGSSAELRKKVTLPLNSDGVSDKELFSAMAAVLDNSVNPWTGRFVDKLYGTPLPVGMAAELLLTAINANAHVISASPMLCLAEEACVDGLAELLGWNVEASDGLTMPGGSACNTLAIQTALTSLFPSFKRFGITSIITEKMEIEGRSAKASRPLIFTSKESHYSLEKAAIACGLGLDCVIAVACDEQGRMRADVLDDMLTRAFNDTKGTGDCVGYPFFVNATAGTTVMGAFDALDQIASACAKHRSRGSQGRLWLHVDASWGGPVLFSSKYRRRLQGVHLFDSFAMCPHKMMNIPHQCSFALFRNGDDLANNALDAPYLFHTENTNGAEEDIPGYKARKLLRREHPATMAFGCGRRGDALKLYLAWLSKGSSYFGHSVDQGIELAQNIARQIQGDDEHLAATLELTSRHGGTEDMYAQVCFRPRLSLTAHKRPREELVEEKSKAVHHVHRALRQQQRFAVDFAPVGGNQGDFIRMITHPSCSIEDLMDLVRQIAQFGLQYDEQLGSA